MNFPGPGASMKIGRTKLETVSGDITKLAVDAIVNPANTMLWTGGGISARIRHEGGASIETEALSKAPAAIGSAVVTTAGTLPSKHVIHAVICGQDLATDENAIRSATEASLKKADAMHLSSLAIPLIDSASFDVEIHVAARSIVDVAVRYLVDMKTTLDRVVFVEHDEELRGVFDSALNDVFTKR